MYKIISPIFALIRQCYLPNPFEVITWSDFLVSDKLPLGLSMLTSIVPLSLILNLLFEPILSTITFVIVDMFYGHKFPAFGSLLYMIFYCIHIFLIQIILLVSTKETLGLVSAMACFLYGLLLYVLLNIINKVSFVLKGI